jgi:cephalosporin-C deacetylase
MSTLEHNFPFDPTYGYDHDRLLSVGAPDEPADFVAFWRETYVQTLAIQPNISRRPIHSPHPNVDLFEIEFDSFANVRIGGWLTLPKADAPITRGAVVTHGYGGRDAPGNGAPGPVAATIYPCLRGFHRSRHPDIPNVASGHVVCGIGSRETYVHRGCAADVWAAASVLLELFPRVAGSLDYIGESFGGGIGALALPWDDRFRRAMLGVPSFGNHPLRLTCECVGSGESVRAYHREHPEVMNVLPYFDAAIAARHIRIPTLVAAALFDPAVPPPGQFAVYNAMPGPKELFVLKHGHFGEDKAQDLAYARAQTRWFNAA